jgi:hypothetical protein
MIGLISLLIMGTALFSDQEPIRQIQPSRRQSAAKTRRIHTIHKPRYGQSESSILNNISETMKKFDSISEIREQSLHAIQQIDQEAESTIRSAIRTAPSTLASNLASVISSAASHLSDPVTAQNIEATQGMSASSAISSMMSTLSKSPAVAKLTEASLQWMERQGFLGVGTLSDIVSLLASIAAGGAELKKFKRGEKMYLSTKYISISFDKFKNFETNTRIPVKKTTIGLSISAGLEGLQSAGISIGPVSVRATSDAKVSVTAASPKISYSERGSTRVTGSVAGSVQADPSGLTGVSISAPTTVRWRKGETVLSPYASWSKNEKEIGATATLKF